MAKNKIATAYVQVLPSMEGVAPKVQSVFSGAGDSSGSAFGGNLVGKIKGIIATAGLGKLLGDSIMAGADLEQSIGGIETLFKDNAATVIKNAEKAYKTAGMSANQYMETVTSFSASLLQGLSGDTEKAASVADMALTDMSDNANKMGTSMESIQNAYQGFAKQNYTMLDNLKLGYGGTKTEMERLLKDAQKLTGVKYDISNLSDVYEAIHVIQEEMGITGTTAAEASATIAGSLTSMKAAFGNVMADLALGRDLEESLSALTDTAMVFLTDNLLPAVGRVLDGLPAVLSTAFSAAIQGLNIAANNADAILQQGVDLVISIGSSIITALPYLAEAAWNIVSAIGTAIITTDWIQIGKDTIAELRNSLDLAAAEILGADGNIVQAVLDAISAGLPSILESGVDMVLEMVNGICEAAPGFLETAGNLLAQFVDTIMSALPDVLSGGMKLVEKLVSGLNLNLPEIINSAAGIIAELLATFGRYLPDLLQQGFVLIGELIAGIISAIPDVIESIPKVITGICDTFAEWDWGEIGSNIVDGIANGILTGAGSIWTAAKNAAKSALNAAKDFLQIKSPSRKMRDEVGKFIPSGLAAGIEENTAPLTSAMKDLAYQTTSTIQQDLDLEGALALPDSYGKSGSYKVAGNQLFSDDTLERIIEDIIQSNIAGHEATVAVLREILEAILGIEIDGEIISKAVERYNRKMAVVRGG